MKHHGVYGMTGSGTLWLVRRSGLCRQVYEWMALLVAFCLIAQFAVDRQPETNTTRPLVQLLSITVVVSSKVGGEEGLGLTFCALAFETITLCSAFV